MKPEQQRIAIAEACGWYDLVEQDISLFGKHEPESQKTFELDVPDYLNDLNAMHEAEKRIKGTPYWKTYETLLAQIVSGDNGMFHITAPQRAEAFLRTLNLWKD